MPLDIGIHYVRMRREIRKSEAALQVVHHCSPDVRRHAALRCRN
jgi:hypothetical protein